MFVLYIDESYIISYHSSVHAAKIRRTFDCMIYNWTEKLYLLSLLDFFDCIYYIYYGTRDLWKSFWTRIIKIRNLPIEVTKENIIFIHFRRDLCTVSPILERFVLFSRTQSFLPHFSLGIPSKNRKSELA